MIGKGSFGQVVKAYDHKEHHHVAVKMVRNEKRFHRQVRRVEYRVSHQIVYCVGLTVISNIPHSV